VVAGGPACGLGQGVLSGARREQDGPLTAMHLIGGEHLHGGQRVEVVVPVVKLGEVGEGFGQVGEAARIGRMGLDGAEVGFDARVVIRLTGTAEELGDAELLETEGAGSSRRASGRRDR